MLHRGEQQEPNAYRGAIGNCGKRMAQYETEIIKFD